MTSRRCALAYRSLDCDGAVRFAQGLTMSKDSSANMGWGTDLLNCTVEFVSKLREIAMDHVEFCIINAIVLTYPGIRASYLIRFLSLT